MTTPLLELKSKHIRALEILHTKLQENVALRAEVESMEQASKQELSAELERLRAELSAKHEYELEALRMEARKQSEKVQELLAQLAEERKSCNSRVEGLKTEKEALAEELAQLKQRAEANRSGSQQAEEEAQSLKAAVARLRQQLKGAEQRAGDARAEVAKQSEQARREREAAEAREAELSAKMAAAADAARREAAGHEGVPPTAIAGLRSEVERLTRALEEEKARHAGTAQERDGLQVTVNELRARVRELESQESGGVDPASAFGKYLEVANENRRLQKEVVEWKKAARRDRKKRGGGASAPGTPVAGAGSGMKTVGRA